MYCLVLQKRNKKTFCNLNYLSMQTIAERRSQMWSASGPRKNWWERERERRSKKRQSAESAAHLSFLRLRVPA